MVRPLDNQEHINPPEYTDRIAKLKRRSEAESRDFTLNMKEVVREKEDEEKNKQKEDRTLPQDSIELSQPPDESEPKSEEEPPQQKPKLDSIDFTI